jgi:hypothetical protein
MSCFGATTLGFYTLDESRDAMKSANYSTTRITIMQTAHQWVSTFNPYLFSTDIAQFPSQLQPMIQQGYLETELEDFLTAHNGYFESSDGAIFSQKYEKHRGTTITETRPGLKAPVVTVTANATAVTGPSDGITPTDFAIEQYTFTPFEIEDGMDLDLIGTNFSIVDRFMHQLVVAYHQGVQSIDLLARDTFLASYATGSTVATTGYSTGSAVAVAVDDIRAFQTVITTGTGGTNGAIVATNSTNSLPITIYPGGSTTGAWTTSVTLATPAGTNISKFVPYGLGTYGSQGAPNNCRANGVSGTLTMNVTTAIVSGDVIVAGDAPSQIIATGVLHFSKLPTTGSSLLSTNILDCVNILENNAVPHAQNNDGDSEGTYIAHIAPNVLRSLYNDPDFKQANQTLGQSAIYKAGETSKYLGVTFLKTTNAPRIPLTAYGGSGYAYATIITGHGALVDRWYEGLEDWAANSYNPGYVTISGGVAFILMPAYQDRQGRNMHIDWLSIRDMVCPTDVTRSTVILTGNGARRARSVVLWTYASF